MGDKDPADDGDSGDRTEVDGANVSDDVANVDFELRLDREAVVVAVHEAESDHDCVCDSEPVADAVVKAVFEGDGVDVGEGA